MGQVAVRYFNPRSRVGSDPLLHHRLQDSSYFNPRSRVGSDVPDRLAALVDVTHFNPRSRVGSDEELAKYRQTLMEFQPTLPRGERRPYRVLFR